MLSAGTAALLLVIGCSQPSEPRSTGASPSAKSPAPTAVPSAVSSTISAYLANIYSPAIARIRAVVVTVNGVPVVRSRRGDPQAKSYDVHSVTKSVTGTLVGIALHEGKLRSLDQTLATLLPDHRARMDGAVAGITLRQLLTMTSGLAGDPATGEAPVWTSTADWVAEILDAGVVTTPGTSFSYSSAGSHLLAAVLTHATGMSLLDYARPRLFDPLGIDTTGAAQPRFSDKDLIAQYDAATFAWPKDPTGIQCGAATLKMAPDDMEKIGRLYLQNGRWNGHQLVPTTWVAQATSEQVKTQGSLTVAEAYGYHWWVTTERRHHAYLAAGFGGQLIEVVPDVRLVVVTVTDADPNTNPRWEHLRGMVSDAILPAVGG